MPKLQLKSCIREKLNLPTCVNSINNTKLDDENHYKLSSMVKDGKKLPKRMKNGVKTVKNVKQL